MRKPRLRMAQSKIFFLQSRYDPKGWRNPLCLAPAASELPLRLPEVENYQPSGTGESPLSTISEWLGVWFDLSSGQTISRSQDRPDGGNWISATRETNTMPQWAGSCWYHLRYLDPSNSEHPVAPEKEAYWGGPDFYIGGAEHAVLHLLYARFWHRFLHDEGVLSHPEPYKKLFHQGLILGEDGNKMSKSVGLRGQPGCRDRSLRGRFAQAIRDVPRTIGSGQAMERKRNRRRSIGFFAKFTGMHEHSKASPGRGNGQGHPPSAPRDHIQGDRSNRGLALQASAISQMMILSNHMQKAESYSIQSAKSSSNSSLLSPRTWPRNCGKSSEVPHRLPIIPGPRQGEELLVADEITIVFQVNGKLRGQAQFPKDAAKDDIIATAKADAKVQSLDGKEIVKEIVPGKLVNLAVKG